MLCRCCIRWFVAASLILGWLSAPGAAAGTGLGLYGGGIVADANGAALDSLKTNFSARSGLVGGLVIDFTSGEFWSSRFAPGYFQKRVKKELHDIEFGDVRSDLDLTYLEIPVMLRFALPLGPLRPYALGGAWGAYLLEVRERFEDSEFGTYFASEDLDTELDSWDYGYTFGAGLEIPLGALRLFAEGRLERGLAKIGTYDDGPYDLTNEGFVVTGGFVFEIGGGAAPQGPAQPPPAAPAAPAAPEARAEAAARYDAPSTTDDDPRAWPESLDCPLDIDIHLAPAQGGQAVPEGRDAAYGGYTLENNDIDVDPPGIVAERLRNRGDLLAVEGIPDLEIGGAVAGENDLVQIELFNPAGLEPVYLTAYAMAQREGDRVAPKNGYRTLQTIQGRLRFYTSPQRTDEVELPYPVAGTQATLYVEGLTAGRYRLVLLHRPQMAVAEARAIRAQENGNPHQTPAAGGITLDPEPLCWRNVRLTVAVVDLYQQDAREHVFDILWGGRAVFDAHLWPPTGAFTWTQEEDLQGAWVDGKVWNQRVQARGAAPSGASDRIVEVHGAFIPQADTPPRGTMEYGARIALQYEIEGVGLHRSEPVTVMVPHTVTIEPHPALMPLGEPHWGGTYQVTLVTRYTVHDQHARLLRGQGGRNRYERQYGTRLRVYEALGMGVNAVEQDDIVAMNYISQARGRNFQVNIQTRQRRNALPADGSLTDGTFTDTFSLTIDNRLRGILQQEIRENRLAAGSTIFSVSQDIVALLENGERAYDVRIARGNLLDIRGPRERQAAAGAWGGLGFRLALGASGGTAMDTGNPMLVGPDYDPPAPAK